MYTLFLAIEWNASPEIVQIGPLSLRWYGLFFAASFMFGLFFVRKMFLKEGEPEEWLDKVFMYMVIGTIIGARLGHVFFYDWDYYSQHLSEIPQVWRGGLASHGGALGIIISLWIFSKKVSKKSVLWILDRVAAPAALGGFFVRMGNLMNSEIIGIPSDAPWAFIFTSRDVIPRHPVQLYEALSYLAIFAILYYTYWYTNKKEKSGYIIGQFFVFVFIARLFLEQFKQSQGGFESAVNNALSTGQLLSIPFILVGLYLMFRPEKG